MTADSPFLDHYTAYNLNRMARAGVLHWEKGNGDCLRLTISATEMQDEQYLHLLWKNACVVLQAMRLQGLRLEGNPDILVERERLQSPTIPEVGYELRGIGQLEVLANCGVIFPDYLMYKTQGLSLGVACYQALRGTRTLALLERLSLFPQRLAAEYALGVR